MRQISAVLIMTGLLAGFVITLSVLSGDEQGRVNLLYLLLLFVFLPIAGLALSVVFLLRKSGRGLAGWILELPLWPAALRHELLSLTPGRERKYWLFYQTQLLSLAFAVGGLLAFLLLLVGTDISFVWRSTLLDAPDLLPLLQLLALPWRLWADAQPDLALLQQSQDYRLATPEFTAALLGQWWKYAIAAQLTYTLLPRAILALLARSAYRSQRAVAAPSRRRKILHVDAMNTVPMQGHLAPVVDSVPAGYVLVDWATLPEQVMKRLQKVLGDPMASWVADPLVPPDPQQLQNLGEAPLVVTVKAWEPPMGELEDYLKLLRENGADLPALILPLDWEGNSLHLAREINLKEWRRFCGTLGGWSVLQPAADRGGSS